MIFFSEQRAPPIYDGQSKRGTKIFFSEQRFVRAATNSAPSHL